MLGQVFLDFDSKMWVIAHFLINFGGITTVKSQNWKFFETF